MRKVAGITLVATVAAAGVLVGIGTLTRASLAEPVAASCVEQPAQFPPAGVSGWRGDQLENAAVIIRTAQARSLGREAQILGVMTAMGESSLHNIDHGDWETSGVTNPDGTRTSSVGLFQQQEWWGTREERMDPATAADRFFARLELIPDWAQLPPSHAIHRVQINANREHYARFEADAVDVVDALSGTCP